MSASNKEPWWLTILFVSALACVGAVGLWAALPTMLGVQSGRGPCSGTYILSPCEGRFYLLAIEDSAAAGLIAAFSVSLLLSLVLVGCQALYEKLRYGKVTW